MIKAPTATVALAIAILVVAMTGCGNQTRPSVEEWRSVWESVVDSLPTAAELGQPPDQGLCSSALAMLRSQSGSLFPTPDLAVDPVVRLWVQVAEETFFECPPRSAQIPNLEAALGELDRLEAEVDVVLSIDEAE